MKAIRYAELNMETFQWDAAVEVSYEYEGPLELACGAGKEMKESYAAMKDLTSTITGTMTKIFGQNQNILNTITASLTPIVQAGPNQSAYSPEELKNLQTQSDEDIAKQTKGAGVALESQLASRQGNQFIPSGGDTQLRADLLNRSAVATADAHRQNILRGYDLGRQNYFQALSGMTAAPGALESPAISAENPAISSAENQSTEADKIQAANRAWMKPLAGLAGGVLSAIPGVGVAGKAIGAGVSAASKL